MQLVMMSAALFWLVTIACAGGLPPAGTDIVYCLCKGEVDAPELYVEQTGFRVAVKLNEDASEAFSKLTESAIGKRLCVMAGEVVFSDATVSVRVDSGHIASRLLTESEGRDLLRLIRRALPVSPCGVAEGHGAE